MHRKSALSKDACMRGATFVPCLKCRTLVRNAELRVHDLLRGQFTVRTRQACTIRLFSLSAGIRYYSVSMLPQHIRLNRTKSIPEKPADAAGLYPRSACHCHSMAAMPPESIYSIRVPYRPVTRMAVSSRSRCTSSS